MTETESALGAIPAEADRERAPSLVDGAMRLELTAADCGLRYWLRAVRRARCAARYWATPTTSVRWR